LEAGTDLGLEDGGGSFDLRDNGRLDAGGEILEGRNGNVLCPCRQRFERGHEVVKGGRREGGHHGQNQSARPGGEVAEVSLEDLDLVREGIALTGERTVGVSRLLHDERQRRGLLSFIIEGTTDLLEA
jgi:hypothetical protein